MPGYEVKCVNLLLKRHKCLRAMKNPVQTDCGHLFCRECLEPVKRPICPIEKEEIDAGSTFPDNACRREILGLDVYCTFMASGCEWVGPLNSLEVCAAINSRGRVRQLRSTMLLVALTSISFQFIRVSVIGATRHDLGHKPHLYFIRGEAKITMSFITGPVDVNSWACIVTRSDIASSCRQLQADISVFSPRKIQGMIGVHGVGGACSYNKAFGLSSILHIKENSVLKTCWADMPRENTTYYVSASSGLTLAPCMYRTTH